MAQGQSSVLAVLLFLSIPLFGQMDQAGFIAPGDSLQKHLPARNIIFLPQHGFSLNESPYGEFKGKILPGPPLDHQNEALDTLLTATIAGNQIRTQLLTPDLFFETMDSSYYLTFTQQRDDHVFVVIDEFQGWLSTDEIRRSGFRMVFWMEFYSQSKNRLIHPLSKTIPIYSKPMEGSPTVAIADELYSELITTGKCDGSFCWVQVVQYKNPYDPSKTKSENVLKKYKGWIRVIDETGQPLIAHHAQGLE